MNPTDKLYELMVSNLERRSALTRDEYYKMANALSAAVLLLPEFKEFKFSENDITKVVLKLQEQYSVHMSCPTTFDDGKHLPWLQNKKDNEGIEPYYWNRFSKYLLKKDKIPPPVLEEIDSITDKTLDYLEDPSKDGNWDKRGMVVGDVQSGKTLNYTSLICKAADAGYKVIIVLAGMLNSLRNQTQERLDSDFRGWCSIERENIGVGLISPDQNKRPFCLTTKIHDFKKETSSTNSAELDAINRPVLFVVKKNSSSLKELFSWLVDNNPYDLKNYPMLMIDDEADHASINTKDSADDPTTINKAIRNLLKVFQKSAFVGYTATPFANIFIDPKDNEDMISGEIFRDLFPRNFIISLDPPDNYVGADQVFNQSSKATINIRDHEAYLPTSHKKELSINNLPGSLIYAINCFILTHVIRELRGQTKFHHSMMINVSTYKDVHKQIKSLVTDRIQKTLASVRNYIGLIDKDALSDENIYGLKQVFDEQYSHCTEWSIIKKNLHNSLKNINVITVNSSADGEKLDYSEKRYPEGRKVIAIGGHSLARGITLEGLTISYFLRNSKMYDTLMQMGRWFGYRGGYGDICKIFLTEEAESWYRKINDALKELREDFKIMEKHKLTPMEVGLRVRSDPTSLIVTARNKMRTGKKVPHQVSLEGRLIETLYFDTSTEVVRKNTVAVDNLLNRIRTSSTEVKPNGYLWTDVEIENTISFLYDYISHPESFKTFFKEPLIDHLEKLKIKGLRSDIFLKAYKPKSSKEKLPYSNDIFGEMQGHYRSESDEYETARGIQNTRSFKNKARLGESKDEMVSLKPNQIALIEQEFGTKKTLNPKHYRDPKIGTRNPLLIIHTVTYDKEDKDKYIVGYGLSFPGSSTHPRRMQNLVEYVVNTKYYNDNYAQDLTDNE